jgi:hypothetical protein
MGWLGAGRSQVQILSPRLEKALVLPGLFSFFSPWSLGGPIMSNVQN